MLPGFDAQRNILQRRAIAAHNRNIFKFQQRRHVLVYRQQHQPRNRSVARASLRNGPFYLAVQNVAPAFPVSWDGMASAMKTRQRFIHSQVKIVVMQHRYSIGRIALQRIQLGQLPVIVRLVIGRYCDQPRVHRPPLARSRKAAVPLAWSRKKTLGAATPTQGQVLARLGLR
jgi:hypothetical protein